MYSVVACLGHVAIDHASRSEKEHRFQDTSKAGHQVPFLPCYPLLYFLLILSPSWFAVSGYHLPRRTATVFSPLSSEGRGEGEGCTHFMHNRSPKTIDPRIQTMPTRSRVGFPPTRQASREPKSAKRRGVFGRVA